MKIASSLGAVWPSWYDPDGSIFGAYRGEYFPTMVVVDHTGVVRLYEVGAQSGPAFEAFLDKLIVDAEKSQAN